MGTCCETICKHRIIFQSIHLAWLPQERSQGKQKCDKNSKNINLRRYFKVNREANCNTSNQTFMCPMCTATLCNLCYIVVCCELLVYFSDKKSCNSSTTLQNSNAQFVSDSWASCFTKLSVCDSRVDRRAYVAPSSVLSLYYDKICIKFASHHLLLYVVYMC